MGRRWHGACRGVGRGWAEGGSRCRANETEAVRWPHLPRARRVRWSRRRATVASPRPAAATVQQRPPVAVQGAARRALGRRPLAPAAGSAAHSPSSRTARCARLARRQRLCLRLGLRLRLRRRRLAKVKSRRRLPAANPTASAFSAAAFFSAANLSASAFSAASLSAAAFSAAACSAASLSASACSAAAFSAATFSAAPFSTAARSAARSTATSPPPSAPPPSAPPPDPPPRAPPPQTAPPPRSSSSRRRLRPPEVAGAISDGVAHAAHPQWPSNAPAGAGAVPRRPRRDLRIPAGTGLQAAGDRVAPDPWTPSTSPWIPSVTFEVAPWIDFARPAVRSLNTFVLLPTAFDSFSLAPSPRAIWVRQEFVGLCGRLRMCWSSSRISASGLELPPSFLQLRLVPAGSCFRRRTSSPLRTRTRHYPRSPGAGSQPRASRCSNAF